MRLLTPAAAALLSLLALTGAPASAATQPLSPKQAVAGRQLLKSRIDCIVSVELLVSARFSMRGRAPDLREQRKEVNATLVGPGGLAVFALSTVDPRSGVMAGAPGIHIEDPDFKEVRLRLADGTELPARLVWQDSMLDLAFVAVDKAALPSRPLPHLNLTESAEPELLDTVFELLRAPKAQQRTPIIRAASIGGIATQPRHFFLSSENAASCPSFDLKGRLLGISVRHFSNGQPGGLILLPAAEIAPIAKQAAAKAAEPPPAPPATPEPPAPTPAAPPPPSPAAPTTSAPADTLPASTTPAPTPPPPAAPTADTIPAPPADSSAPAPAAPETATTPPAAPAPAAPETATPASDTPPAPPPETHGEPAAPAQNPPPSS